MSTGWWVWSGAGCRALQGEVVGMVLVEVQYVGQGKVQGEVQGVVQGEVQGAGCRVQGAG